MNEKIKEISKKAFMLAHEANDIHEQEEGEELSQTQFSNVFNQKLIELTVRECAGVNYKSSFKDGEFHAREVLEHFGVEE